MNLTLYYFPSCPYCGRVLQYLRQNKINIPMKDTALYPENRQELIKIGGKSQVPCLVIDGEPMYESMDIIEWLKENKDKL